MCSDKIARKPSVPCAGLCNSQFHAACVNIPADFASLFTNIKGLFWKCPTCLSSCGTENELQKNIELKFQALVADFMEKFSDLKTVLLNEASNKIADIIPKMHENISATVTTSYADKVSSGRVKKIILRPKDQEQPNSQTKVDIINSLNPSLPGTTINTVKHLNHGGIILGCENQGDSTRIKEITEQKLGDKYEIRELKSLNPRIRIVGISQEIDKNRLCEWIMKQNKDIFETNSFEILHIWPTKKRDTLYQATLQVTEKVYRKLMNANTILVGLDTCKVYDAINVIRCFKCNSLNHGSKVCKGSLTCPLCAGNHMINECQVKDPDHYKCSNCISLKQKQKSNININHAAWNYGSCHAYKQALEKFKLEILGSQ